MTQKIKTFNAISEKGLILLREKKFEISESLTDPDAIILRSHKLSSNEFGNNLKTENGADIDGYIKKTNKSKSTLTGDFLFKKKEKKEVNESEDRPDVVNKEAIA